MSTWWYTGAVLALVLALSLTASLDADPAFTDAQKLYRALEYEQAILRFQEIAVRPSLAPDEKAEALVWLGLSYAGIADFESARRYLKLALVTDENVALPDKVAPRIATLFADLRDEVRAERITPPPPPPAPPAKQAGRADTGVVVAAVAGGVGVLALAGGVVCAGLAEADYQRASDPNAFQIDAKAQLDASNTELIAALVLLPAGAVLAGTGIALVLMNGGPVGGE